MHVVLRPEPESRRWALLSEPQGREAFRVMVRRPAFHWIPCDCHFPCADLRLGRSVL